MRGGVAYNFLPSIREDGYQRNERNENRRQGEEQDGEGVEGRIGPERDNQGKRDRQVQGDN